MVTAPCFPRAFRLTCASQFQRVFAEPDRTGKVGFVVLYRLNDVGHARLGLAISKKCARRAVDRNRLKRITRTCFRLNHQHLPAVDIVVLCARGAPALTNRQLALQLERAWTTIRNKQQCVESSSV